MHLGYPIGQQCVGTRQITAVKVMSTNRTKRIETGHLMAISTTSGMRGAPLRRSFLGAVAALSLASCGITYHSPSVREQSKDGEVVVVPMTTSVISTANSSPYTPRGLPDVFFANAGTGNAKGAGALPSAPFLPDEQPRALQYRPLPDVAPQLYRIGVGDELLLSTKSAGSTVEELTGLLAAANQRQGYTVRADGTIAIPEIQPIEVAGLTQDEAENRLFRALVDSQINPSFSLEIVGFNSQRVAIGGAVGQPTVVPITLTNPTLGEALIAAGGFTVRDREFASIRIYRDGTLYQIPLTTYVENPGLKDKMLVNGDAVFVDTTYDLDRALTFYQARIDVISMRTEARAQALEALNTEVTLRRMSLEDQRANYERRRALGEDTQDYVYLTGEVNNQNRVPLPYGRRATLADVLFGDGGFDTMTGNPSQIYVLRSTTSADAVTAYHLNARDATKLVLATRFEMRPNDVVFIEEQPITKWNRAFNQLLPSLFNQAAAATQ